MSLPVELDALNDNPLYRALGIRITAREDGTARSELRAPEYACWPEAGQPHGGVLFTQLDTTCATAVLSGPHLMGTCSTIGLDVHYLAPATGPVLRCTAQVERRGLRVCFVRASTMDEHGEVVALAQGSFRVFAGS